MERELRASFADRGGLSEPLFLELSASRLDEKSADDEAYVTAMRREWARAQELLCEKLAVAKLAHAQADRLARHRAVALKDTRYTLGLAEGHAAAEAGKSEMLNQVCTVCVTCGCWC